MLRINGKERTGIKIGSLVQAVWTGNIYYQLSGPSFACSG